MMLILPHIKIYRRYFSRHQCGFRKGYTAQHCLLAMIEKWKKIVDYGGVFGALLTDLSKVFDCIPHDLFIGKLEVYGFQTDALNGEYGVQQGSILGPLLFNIHLCDLFCFLEDLVIASYADDTTIYVVKENKESVINTLEA